MIRSSLFNDLVGLRNTIDQVFGDTNSVFGALTPWTETASIVRSMPLDVYATDEQVVIMAAVPGMQPDDLDLTVHQNTVTLSGQVGSVADTEEAKGATWYVRELPSGTFRRSITLPFTVDADRAEAHFEHGILRVVLPKAESAKPKRIAIGVGQQQAIGAGASQS